MVPPGGRLPVHVRRIELALGEQVVERARIEDRVRAAGVGVRVADEHPDPRRLAPRGGERERAQRQPEIREHGGVAVLVVGPVVVGVQPAGGERIIEHDGTGGVRRRASVLAVLVRGILRGRSGERRGGAAEHAGEVQPLAKRRKRAAFRRHFRRERPRRVQFVAAPAEELDRAGQRPGPIERGLRPALHLDAAQAVAGQVGEIEEPGQPLVDRDAVDEHLRMPAFQPAGKHAGELPRRAGLHDVQPRHGAQGVGHPVGLPFGQLVTGDDRHRRRRSVLRHRQARGGDDHSSRRDRPPDRRARHGPPARAAKQNPARAIARHWRAEEEGDSACQAGGGT